MKPIEDPSWDAYGNTILHFANGFVLDLRIPLSREDIARLSTLGSQPEFGILSASNPTGLESNDAVNQKAADALQRELKMRSVGHVAVVGHSPEGDVKEPGFAVFTSLQEARQLGAMADQSAIFWFDGAAFWLVGAKVDAKTERLPRAR